MREVEEQWRCLVAILAQVQGLSMVLKSAMLVDILSAPVAGEHILRL